VNCDSRFAFTEFSRAHCLVAAFIDRPIDRQQHGESYEYYSRNLSRLRWNRSGPETQPQFNGDREDLSISLWSCSEDVRFCLEPDSCCPTSYCHSFPPSLGSSLPQDVCCRGYSLWNDKGQVSEDHEEVGPRHHDCDCRSGAYRGESISDLMLS